VRATTHWQDPKAVAEASRGLGEPMRGLEISAIPEAERLQTRGW
jgi:pyridoxal 5'-phosphate synthase pdxS subunit